MGGRVTLPLHASPAVAPTPPLAMLEPSVLFDDAADQLSQIARSAQADPALELDDVLRDVGDIVATLDAIRAPPDA